MSLANENNSCRIESDAHKVIFTSCIYDNTIVCTIPYPMVLYYDLFVISNLGRSYV